MERDLDIPLASGRRLESTRSWPIGRVLKFDPCQGNAFAWRETIKDVAHHAGIQGLP